MSFSDVPMTMSVILDASPRPMMMNRIGSSASGGTIDSTATMGPNVMPATGSRPIKNADTSAIAVEMASAHRRSAERRQRVVQHQVVAGPADPA